ncbi:MAG: hypothetical protein ACJ71S_03385 [Acidobacteriaceae bacterium]
MFQSFLRTCLIAAIPVAALLCLPANAQQAAVRSQVIGRIDSRRASEGGSFFVKTTSAWKESRCVIPSGALLEGHIANLQRKGAGVKREEMDLRFLPLPCSGDEAQQIIPVLIAMQGAQDDPREGFIMQEQMASALSAQLRRAPGSTGASGTSSNSPASPGNMSGSAGSVGNFSPSSANQRPLHPQEVRGVPGVKLSLPILITDPTALSSSNQILIDPETQFLLVLQLAPRPKPSDTPAAERATITRPATEPAAPPVKPPVEEDVEIEQCVETGCAFADSPDASVVDNQLERTLSLHAFGYKVRGNRVLRSLAEDAAVRFLGRDQLLITFNAHPLIVRSQDESSRLASPRIIRALLFSIKTGKIVRAEDWRVPGEGPYLWPLDGGRVLAHVGSILAVYGPGLKLERQWSPGGEVRFLRVSPSRHLIVAAIAHERHTPEQHRRIAEFVGPEHPVDEDFDLILLDGQLNVQATRRLQTWPTLSEVLDTGLIVTERGLHEKWIVSESDWEAKRHPLVRVDSGCPLRVETLPTSLILIIGCSLDEASAWYKIVRSNGKTLLNGNIPSNGVLAHADAPAGAGVFAIGIAEASHPVDFVQGIVASDFQNVAVSVYRIADGHRLFATRSANGAVNRQSFALSESGDRLALLSGDRISLYRIDKPEHPSR